MEYSGIGAMEMVTGTASPADAGPGAPTPSTRPVPANPARRIRRAVRERWTGADRRRLLLRRTDVGRAYRGPDRRPAPPTLPPGRAAALAASLLLAVFALGITYSLTRSGPASVRAADSLLVWTLTATFTTAAGAMSVVNWRVTGRSRNLPFGVAFLVLGVAGFGLGGVVPVLRPGLGSDLSLQLRTGAGLAAVLLLAVASRLPEIDTRLRPIRLLAATAAVATAASTALVLLPGAAITWVAEPVLAFAWTAVGSSAVRRGLRSGRWLDTWLGLSAVGFGLASANAAVAGWAGRPPEAAFLIVAAVAALYAVIGVQQELSLGLERAREQAERLADAVSAAEELRHRERSEREERDHDLRSALFALEAAARALESSGAAAAPADGGLAGAIASELGRVKAMVAAAGSGSGTFTLADAVLPIISLELARGVDLRAEIPADLVAHGSAAATAEIVRNLLDNAWRYAPGTPVRVTAERVDDRLLLRVADMGPGIAPEDRLRLFERGRRGPSSAGRDGSGLGLFVCARLAREQGATLTVDDATGGGACFLLSLPRPPAAGAGRRPADPVAEPVAEPAADPVAEPTEPASTGRATHGTAFA